MSYVVVQWCTFICVIMLVLCGKKINQTIMYDWFNDSPPKTSDFLQRTNVSCPLDARKDTIENKVSIHFLVCRGLSIDEVGVSRDTVFQEIRSGVSFETTGDFVKWNLRGLLTVERLISPCTLPYRHVIWRTVYGTSPALNYPLQYTLDFLRRDACWPISPVAW